MRLFWTCAVGVVLLGSVLAFFVVQLLAGPVEIFNPETGACMHQIEYDWYGRKLKRVECFTHGELVVQRIPFAIYYGGQ